MIASLTTPAESSLPTPEENFAQRVDQIIHEQCRTSGDHCFDRHRTQVLWQLIDLQHGLATWLLCEHVRNEEYLYRESVAIWSQAQFRYSLWRLHRNHAPVCAYEETIRVRRLNHRWSIFQQKPWRWVTDDLFAIVTS